MSFSLHAVHRRINRRDILPTQLFGGGGGSNPSSDGTGTTSSTSTDATTTTDNGNGNGNGKGGHQSATSTTTSSQTTSTSSTTTSSSTTTTSTSSKSSSSSTQNTDTTSSTSSTTTTTSTTSQTTTSTSATSSKTSSSSVTTTTTGAPQGNVKQQQQTGFNTLASTPTLTGTGTDNTPTVSSTPAASGSLNTGALAGGIAAGLIALGILAAVIAFYVRRHKSRRRAEEFDAAQFRRSAVMMDGESRASFWGGAANAVRPISTFFTNSWRPGHNVAPSIGSTQSAGLAGQGAYSHQEQQQEYYHDQVLDQYQDAPEMMQTHTTPVTPAPASGQKVLQPRQQYTFGQAYEPEPLPAIHVSDHGHGEYYPYATQQGYDYQAHEHGDYHNNNPFASHDMPVSYPDAGAVHPERGMRDEDVYGGM